MNLRETPLTREPPAERGRSCRGAITSTSPAPIKYTFVSSSLLPSFPPHRKPSAESTPAVVIFEFAGGAAQRPEAQCGFEIPAGLPGEPPVRDRAENHPGQNHRKHPSTRSCNRHSHRRRHQRG